jgi:aldehyde:ferredoxin oxidoreductase
MGGEFGAALIKAGFSHLLITGRSRRPVYLFIRNGEVILELIHRIAYRKGFGDLLVQGSYARKAFGDVSRDYLLAVSHMHPVG